MITSFKMYTGDFETFYKVQNSKDSKDIEITNQDNIVYTFPRELIVKIYEVLDLG